MASGRCPIFDWPGDFLVGDLKSLVWHEPHRTQVISDRLAADVPILICWLSGMLQKFHSFRPIPLSFLTYVLLSYFIRLHCTNVHTPLPLLSYFYDTEHQDKVSTFIWCWRMPTGQLGYRSWLSSYSGPGSAPSSHRRGVSALSGDSTMSRPAMSQKSRQNYNRVG